MASGNAAVIGDLDNEFAAALASDPAFESYPITNRISTYLETSPLVFTSPSMVPSPWPKSALFESQRFPGSRPASSGFAASNTASSKAWPVAPSVQYTSPVLSPSPPTCVQPAFTSRSLLPTSVSQALVQDLPSGPYTTPSIPSATSSKFDIPSPVYVRLQTSTDPLLSRSPNAQFLKHLSGYQTVNAAAFPWPPLVPIPEPSGYLSRALIQYQASGKVYLLRLFEERLMSVQHELSTAENAYLVARAEKKAIELRITSLMGSPDLEDEEKRLVDVKSGAEGGVSLTEIEDQTWEDGEGETTAVGDVKWWIGLQEIRRQRDVQLSVCDGLVKNIEKKRGEVQKLVRDVEFLTFMISVQDALKNGILVPGKQPFGGARLT